LFSGLVGVYIKKNHFHSFQTASQKPKHERTTMALARVMMITKMMPLKSNHHLVNIQIRPFMGGPFGSPVPIISHRAFMTMLAVASVSGVGISQVVAKWIKKDKKQVQDHLASFDK